MLSRVTIALVKPVAVAAGHAPDILLRAVQASLMPTRIARRHLDQSTAEAFYAEHRGRPHFPRIVADLSSAPCVIAELRTEDPDVDAVTTWRTLLGPADPRVAPPGTIRRDYGTVLPMNAAHGADGAGAVLRETALLFAHHRTTDEQFRLIAELIGVHELDNTLPTPRRDPTNSRELRAILERLIAAAAPNPAASQPSQPAAPYTAALASNS
jgi:nucleoside-diphosphate kinase